MKTKFYKIITALAVLISTSLLISCNSSTSSESSEVSNMDKAKMVLMSLESKDKEPAMNYISEETYIQHNLSAPDGREGFLGLLGMGIDFKVNIVRAFEYGNFVFTHTEYDFFGPKAGFDIFRFKDGKIVEHWDNLQEIAETTVSGRTQTDGPTASSELNKTEENIELVKNFLDDILVNGKFEKITEYISTEKYHQHNPNIGDGLDGLNDAITAMAENGITMVYTKVHKVLGEGNFVLAQSEGEFGGAHTAYYDLFRIEDGKIVEHWDTIETIPAESEWQNSNGKF